MRQEKEQLNTVFDQLEYKLSDIALTGANFYTERWRL